MSYLGGKQQERMNAVWSHLHAGYKTVKRIAVEQRSGYQRPGIQEMLGKKTKPYSHETDNTQQDVSS